MDIEEQRRQGLKIARERIAKECREKTGLLDLGELALVEIPEEIVEITNLRLLNLGTYYGMERIFPPALGQFAKNSIKNHSWNRIATLNVCELYISNLEIDGLDCLTPLQTLVTLSCSVMQISDLSPLSDLQALSSLDCSHTEVSDLSPLSNLQALSNLDCSHTEVSDLSPLSNLQALSNLDCSSTQLADLLPLSDLQSLSSLACRNTQVVGLSPLSDLQALSTLDCSGTQVTNLSPLSDLQTLSALDCAGTQVTDLSPLSDLQALSTLGCAGTQVTDLSPLSNLQALKTLRFFDTQVSCLSPLSNLQALNSLNCSKTEVSDLSPLSELQALNSLSCSKTEVSDLSPLSELQALNSLSCSETEVSDLSPLSELQALNSLTCWNTQVADLSPLSGLKALSTLDFDGTRILDLSPLSELQTLSHLDCSNTQVADLSPLSDLSALRDLTCSNTQVADLFPLSNLSTLRNLTCSNTQVSDLSPLSDLQALNSLDCSNTHVSDLLDLLAIKDLQELNAFGCRVSRLDSEQILARANMQLMLNNVDGIPPELLSRHKYDSCFAGLRSHFLDLADGSEPITDVKMMLLGNGRVGKTQIARRLKGLEPEADPLSTHGVLVDSTDFPLESEDSSLVNLWDFGGQDVYHATHSLFMRSQAIFAVVWSSDSENAQEHEYGGMTFRNYPVPYWLSYIESLAGTASPVIVIQNKCELATDEERTPPYQPHHSEPYECFKNIHYSAKSDRGRDFLDGAIRQSIEHLHDSEQVSRVGLGRVKVRRELEKLRDADAACEVSERSNRTISLRRFNNMCEQAGSISSTEHFLQYLHNCGTIFYHKDLFGNKVILDQSWALDAIYSVLHREQSLRQIKYRAGRFDQALLNLLVWQDFSSDEQQLFISMMVSCGICFKHREEDKQLDIAAEYVVPDLLPDFERVEAQVAAQWEHAAVGSEVRFLYPFMHHALIRALISAIGDMAGGTGIYWKYGVCAYESRRASHIKLEYQQGEGYQGQILIQCKGKAHGELLQKLVGLVERENQKFGVKGVEREGDLQHLDNQHQAESKKRGSIDGDAEFKAEGDTDDSTDKLKFSMPPRDSSSQQCFVSYAWGDDSTEGKKLSANIEKLCQEAEQKGIQIIRDKDFMQVGDKISKFMDTMARGQRVYILLSDKYLKSYFCMYELFQIWRQARGEEQDFFDRISVYKSPDVLISTFNQRATYIRYWKDEFQQTKQAITELGIGYTSPDSVAAYHAMTEFAQKTDEILGLIADRLMPSSIEELVSLEPDGDLE